MTGPFKNYYYFCAYVLRGLDQLRRHGNAVSALDVGALAVSNVELFRTRPHYIKLRAFAPPEPRGSSLFLGEAGILLVASKLGHEEFDDDLRRLLAENVDNEAEEVFWGVPGSLIAAAALGDQGLWNRLAEALLARRRQDGLWTQRLYAGEYQSLTPPHGLAGIV